MRWILAAAATACSTLPATPPSTEPAVARARVEVDRAHGCTDTCCLPHAAWFGGGAIDDADLAHARAALGDGGDPRALAIALRAVSARAELADTPALERWLDDARDAGALPAVVIEQRMHRCEPVRWAPTTVATEALVALSRAYATPFASAAVYRAWRIEHPDAEDAFEYWYAQLRTRRPPEPAVLSRLQARSPVLAARVLAAYCDDTCGLTSDELDGVLRRGAHPIAWLTGAETFPEWQRADVFEAVARTLLRRAEALYREADAAALDQLLRRATLVPHLQARLAVVLGRLRRADAPAIWTAALATLTSDRDVVLAEAAEREPIAYADTLAQYFTADDAASILAGLARAGSRAAPTFKRFAQRLPFTNANVPATIALATAARASGCPNIPDPALMEPRSTKGGDAVALRRARLAAHRARSDAFTAVARCVTAP